MPETQEGNNILDLAPSIESLGAHQTIWKPRLQESLFQQTRYGIRAVHHRALTGLKLTRGNQLCNAIDNEGCFCIIIRCFIKIYLFTCPALTKETFLTAVSGPVYDTHGCIKNVLVRAIILFKQDDLRIREVLFKPLNVAPVCTTPGVDGLIGIAHAKNILMIRSELPDKSILCKVGILEFIHQ